MSDRTAQERADIVQFIQLRLRTASEWFDEAGEQVLASEMHQSYNALDALLAEVERLTNVLEYTQMRADAQQERAEAAEREVERLTAELKRAAEFRPLYESAVDRAEAAESERDEARTGRTEALDSLAGSLHWERARAEAAERLAEQRGEALREIIATLKRKDKSHDGYTRDGYVEDIAIRIAHAALADDGQQKEPDA